MKIGDRIKSKNHGYFDVIKKLGGNRVLCRFVDTKYETTSQWTNAIKGTVMDRMMPKIHGVGFIGGTKYKSSTSDGNTIAYDAWRSMLGRCYNKKIQSKHKSYIGCSVCKEWHNFQTFAKWFYDNYEDNKEIDKDIVGDGLVYSPENCTFVSSQANSECANAKNYSFINPLGEVVNVYNLSKFCRENGLMSSKMGLVHAGKRNHHAGWKAATTR